MMTPRIQQCIYWSTRHGVAGVVAMPVRPSGEPPARAAIAGHTYAWREHQGVYRAVLDREEPGAGR